MRIVPAITYPNDLCTPIVSLRLRDDPRAAGRVRVVLRDVFRELTVADETASDGVVMASELVTNALTHAPAPYAFDVCAHTGPLPGDADGKDADGGTGSWLLCEMSDGGPPVPLFDRAEAAVRTDPLAAGGRGLPLVRRLSAGRCGIRALGPGKAVWFAVALP